MVETTKEMLVPSLGQHFAVHEARSLPIVIYGDFLTASRARGAQRAKINSESPSRRFDGLVPASSDWHTKLKLLGVSEAVYYVWNSYRMCTCGLYICK